MKQKITDPSPSIQIAWERLMEQQNPAEREDELDHEDENGDDEHGWFCDD